MFRVAIYARVSSEKQRKDLSIPAQVHECKTFIQSQGWHFFKEYIEQDGVSAFKKSETENRHAFHAMLADAELEMFDIVVVYDYSRFSRLREIHVLYESKLNQFGVTLISATEKVDDSPSGQLLKNILSDMNQFYSETLRVNVKRGQSEMLRQGFWPGVPPVGYKKIDRVCVLDPDKAKIIKTAFHEYATGKYTLNSWADHAFYRLNFLNRKGKRLNLGRWSYIFHNKFYVGVMKWGAIEIMGQHEPLVQADIFDKVQLILSKRSGPAKKDKSRRYYPLSRLIYSDDAESRMVGHVATSGSGSQIRYYKSVNRMENGKGHYIKAGRLEAVFEDFLYNVRAVNELLPDSIDSDILLGLKVSQSVGDIYNVVLPHQQLYISQLVVSGRGVHVKGNSIKYIELNESFKWSGCSIEERWSEQEANRIKYLDSV